MLPPPQSRAKHAAGHFAPLSLPAFSLTPPWGVIFHWGHQLQPWATLSRALTQVPGLGEQGTPLFSPPSRLPVSLDSKNAFKSLQAVKNLDHSIPLPRQAFYHQAVFSTNRYHILYSMQSTVIPLQALVRRAVLETWV